MARAGITFARSRDAGCILSTYSASSSRLPRPNDRRWHIDVFSRRRRSGGEDFYCRTRSPGPSASLDQRVGQHLRAASGREPRASIERSSRFAPPAARRAGGEPPPDSLLICSRDRVGERVEIAIHAPTVPASTTCRPFLRSPRATSTSSGRLGTVFGRSRRGLRSELRRTFLPEVPHEAPWFRLIVTPCTIRGRRGRLSSTTDRPFRLLAADQTRREKHGAAQLEDCG